jgi:N-acetylglutamate synthase-like GNAT family acetyltransferase
MAEKNMASMATVEVQETVSGESGACERLLRGLPGWFGIESSIVQYVKDIETMPTLIARADGEAVGFLTIKGHNEFSAEIHVMAVKREMHRAGVGGSLIRRAEAKLRGEGVEYLQVKTLAPSMPDEGYAATRAFYAAMGFRPLEELADIWDKDNPCLLMVKKL